MQVDLGAPAIAGSSGLFPPRRLRLELALDCPLHCVHCSAHAAPHHPLSMPTDLAFRLIEEVAGLGGEEVTFTGGEPLVDSRLPALLCHAIGLGMSTIMFTSGIVYSADGPQSLSTEQTAKLAPMLSRAVVSVYSADALVHDAITQVAGSLAWTWQAIRRLVAEGVCVELHFVPTSMNYRDLPPLVAAAADRGVAAIRIIRYVPQGRGRAHQDRLRMSADQQRELRALLKAVRGSLGIAVKIGSGFGYLLNDAPPCTAGVDEIVVGADGHVYPCSGFAGIRGPRKLGNIREAPLATIWRNSPYLRTVREMALGQMATPGSQACHPGCPAQKAATGHPSWANAKDPDAAALQQSEIPAPAQ